MRHGHVDVGLVGGVAKHHALVARANEVERVVRAAGLRVKGLVDALRDVGALLVDHVDDAAGLGVKAVLGAVVANAADDVAGDALDVEVGLGANLAGNDDGSRGHKGLAGAAHVVDVGGGAVGRDVALGLELRLLGQERVQDGVGDLVADLVRMPLGHALRGEEGSCGAWRWWNERCLACESLLRRFPRRPLPFRRACDKALLSYPHRLRVTGQRPFPTKSLAFARARRAAGSGEAVA